MKAWLDVEDRGKRIAGEYRIVFNQNDAAKMTENNAHELMRAAENAFPKYAWEMVKIPDSAQFIVEGTEKKL